MAQRFIKPLLASLVAVLAFCPIASAADYYVATTGSDSNPGTAGSPFLTIQKGVDSATTAGDQVLINDGTYTAGFTADTNSGSTEATKSITGVTKANPGVVTSVAHGYSNGDRVAIYGLDDPITNGMVGLNNAWFLIADVTADTFSLQDGHGNAVDTTYYDDYVTGGTVQRITPIIIKAINSGSVTIDSSTTVTGWSGSGQPANTYLSSAVTSSDDDLWKVGNTRLLTQKSSAGTVTSEGSYYFDTSAKTFLIYTTSNPTLSTYKQTGSGSNITRVSWVLIDGIVSQYAAVPFLIGSSSPATAGATSHNYIQYCTAQYAVTWGMAVQTASQNKSSYNTFDNITIQYADETSGGQNGHCFKSAANSNSDDGTFTTIKSSTIHDCKYHGIQSSNAWSNQFFHNNRIYNTSLVSSGSGTDIRCGYSGDVTKPMACRIFDNELGGGSGGSGYGIGCGIYIQDANNGTQIWRNNIHDHNWHGIYVFYAGAGPTSPLNLTAWNNLFWNNKTAGVRCDAANSNLKFYNNSFYNNGEVPLSGIGAGLSINNSACAGIIFKNNIVQSATSASIRTTNYYQLTSDYNDLYTSAGFKVIWNGTTYTDLPSYTAAATILSGPWDANSVTGDPLYGNPTIGDLRIPSPLTPADSSGVNLIATVPNDYTVTARQVPFDIGAYNTQGNLLIFPSVSLASYFPSYSGTVTVSFTTSALTINKNYKIVFTFPAGFTLDNGGSTVAQNFTNMDGTFTTSVVGQVVTITRNNDGTNSIPNTFTFDLTNVRNPSATGLTGKYSISVTDSSDVMQGESLLFSDSLITELSPGAISGATVNGLLWQ